MHPVSFLFITYVQLCIYGKYFDYNNNNNNIISHKATLGGISQGDNYKVIIIATTLVWL